VRLAIPIIRSEESPSTPIELTLPGDVNLNKVRGTLRSPVPDAIRPPDQEVFVLTLLPNGGRPPVPGFVRVVSINRNTIRVSDGLAQFLTFDRRVHQVHFEGDLVEFTDRLNRCVAQRNVICGNRVVDVAQIASFRTTRTSHPVIGGHGTNTDDGSAAA
jgi:hypothetical protein